MQRTRQVLPEYIYWGIILATPYNAPKYITVGVLSVDSTITHTDKKVNKNFSKIEKVLVIILFWFPYYGNFRK